MSTPQRGRSAQSLRWLSQDYAVLRAQPRDTVIDVLIIGSGYGGAMAAAEFAGRVKPDGRPVRVCVLERGKEYAPGMFPSSLQELPGHVRVQRERPGKPAGKPMGKLDGLIDVRVGQEVCALIGNGLGGTSLINAGVMVAPQLRPDQLPEPLMKALTPEYFAEVKRMLGASETLHQDHPRLREQPLRKTEELRRVAASDDAARFEHAAITVQTREGDADVPQCTLCGDCMTGCNVGAKKSLDTTLLARAWSKGAEIYTGGTALRVRRAGDDLWLVQTNFTADALRARHKPRAIRARKVVLAAGTLGSSEILLRSRSSQLRLSSQLGQRFSCNGDNLVAVHDGPRPVHSGAQEWQPLAERHVGPTITGIVRKDGFLMEEFAVPGPLKRLFEETVTTSALLHKLDRWPRRTDSQRQQKLDTAAVDPQAMERTLLVGLIGHDDSQWKIVLPRPARRRRGPLTLDGQVRIEWNGPKKAPPDPRTGEEDPKVPRMEHDFRSAAKLLGKASPGAGVLPNPLWKLLPDSMKFLVESARGPVLTVHPLGGCAMGSSHRDGVVDHLGRVFRRPLHGQDAGGVHEGLIVLDGSIIPGSLAANPALTIAAVARHAAQSLAAGWGWKPRTTALQLPGARPRLRPVEACTPPRPVPTEVELIERLAGPAGPYWVELTAAYQPKAVAELASQAVRELKVREQDPRELHSYIRVYHGGEDAEAKYLLLKEDERDRLCLFKAPLEGSLVISEPALGLLTVLHAGRASWAWLRNRGLREIADKLKDVYKQVLGIPNPDPSPSIDVRAFFPSAARSGQQRCFDYRLKVLADASERSWMHDEALRSLRGMVLSGSKRLTYGRRANPWKQLRELVLDGFPGAQEQPVLKLDGRFLVGRGVPLLRITRQQNQVVALAEFASLGMTWVRLLASIHLWSFRAPDKPLRAQRRPFRLPEAIEGLPPNQRHWLDLEPGRKRPVRALLTQYPNPGASKPPIVLIHGYSASGNTFTHPSIPQPLARHLWQDGREVWVLDLRTSAGFRSARRAWFFEDAALADLPVAIARVCELAGKPVDVFAHCIGAVMLGMALLADPATVERFRRADLSADDPPTRYPVQLTALRDNIRRIVLSQKGPLLVYCDDNVLRAYFMRLLRKVLLPEKYQFSAPPNKGVGDSLLDRVLSTMVYPDDEFDRENPFSWNRRARWAGFRHRMDALYARDFSLKNIEDRTLGAIEELFGPLNLDTVAQAIHFARKNVITDGNGFPFDASRQRLAERWPKGGTLSIHGTENGLVHVKTLEVLGSAMRFAGVPWVPRAIEGYGHQDCLIGRHAARDVFGHISEFLDRSSIPPDPAALAQPSAQASAQAVIAVAVAGAATPAPDRATAPGDEQP